MFLTSGVSKVIRLLGYMAPKFRKTNFSASRQVVPGIVSADASAQRGGRWARVAVCCLFIKICLESFYVQYAGPQLRNIHWVASGNAAKGALRKSVTYLQVTGKVVVQLSSTAITRAGETEGTGETG